MNQHGEIYISVLLIWFINSYLVHPCDKADNAGCEQTCEKKGEEDFICTCPTGFKLNADGKKCDESKLFEF